MSIEPVHSSSGADPKEKFFQHFSSESRALQEQMDRLETLSTIGGERKDAIDHCLAGVVRLQKEIQDASSYITPYDQRIYSEGIKALFEKLDQRRNTLLSKKRFAFKSGVKKSDSAISPGDAAELAVRSARAPQLQKPPISSEESSIAPKPANVGSQSIESSDFFPPPVAIQCSHDLAEESSSSNRNTNEALTIRKMSFASSDSVEISSQKGIHILLPPSAAHTSSSGSLTHLRRCIVDMRILTATGKNFATLAIKDVQKSLLICGSVSGATHVTSVEDSVILAKTAQFRMHECRRCIVYLFVTSKPIVEDCSEIQFAPLPEYYSRDVNQASSENRWNQIQDFKWLRQEPSPNFSVLPLEKRASEETWRKAAACDSGLSLEEILDVVGLAN